MSGSIIIVSSIVLFYFAFRIYSKYISSKIFNLSGENLKKTTPAVEFEDGVDYVPSPRPVLFGHHFSSIAGAAPIVGPAVASIWGWLPATIWVVLGVIFIGAAHDFGALVISMKHKGRSIAEVAENLLGKKIKILFLSVIFFLVWMVIAVFALVIANLFISFPASVIPVNFEIIIALLFGHFISRKRRSLTIPSVFAQIGLFVMIWVGTKYPVSLSSFVGEGNELYTWIIFLLIYSFIASILPVWALLQPRDFINCHQLFLGLGLMVLGIVVVSPKIVAPALNLNPVGAPSWFPFLFITIACGAVSGFHGLVSGGTTSKQVGKWEDARVIGYGSMLGEGLLALLATMAVCTGFKTQALWHDHYASWQSANGLSAKINAFVQGAGNFLQGLGIPLEISETVIAVLIISFAATSLDTACRIQRYIVSEVGESLKIDILKNRYIGSSISVGSAFLLMFAGDGGKGGLLIWPLFGATNQMLASLTLFIIAIYLVNQKKSYKIFLLPAVLITLITGYALILNMISFYKSGHLMLMLIAITLFVIILFIVFEGSQLLRKKLIEN